MLSLKTGDSPKHVRYINIIINKIRIIKHALGLYQMVFKIHISNKFLTTKNIIIVTIKIILSTVDNESLYYFRPYATQLKLCTELGFEQAILIIIYFFHELNIIFTQNV